MLKAISVSAILLLSINMRADDRAPVLVPYLPIVHSTDEIFAPTQTGPLVPQAVGSVPVAAVVADALTVIETEDSDAVLPSHLLVSIAVCSFEKRFC